MFCDQTEITVEGGKGGNGCLAFRREKYVARGGPNGGNGGKGGNVIFQTNPHLNSLIDLHARKFFAAASGTMGSSYLKNGEAGADLILEVPVGTMVRVAESGELMADLNQPKMSLVVARGGRGGYGNAHFKSSTRQAPHFAELGEPGEIKKLKLELQLVADVGIIGLPSSGKSTLISRISAAKPKIGAFPFTTLIPNLGVVKLSPGRSLVVCDIPGLIEGAHEGKGLGHEFLRHISRSRVLVHLIDISGENLAADYKVIRTELKKYSLKLAKKPEIVVFNKLDLLGADEELAKLLIAEFCRKTKITRKKVLLITAISGKNLPELLEKMWALSEKAKAQERATRPSPKHVVLKPHLEQRADERKWEIRKEKDAFRITGQRLEQIAVMTDFDNHEAVMRLRDVLKKMGIEKELLRRGAEQGTKLYFGAKMLEFAPHLLKK